MHDSFQKSLILIGFSCFNAFLRELFTVYIEIVAHTQCRCRSHLYSLCTNMEVKVFNRAGRELAVLSLGEEASVFALKREFHRKCEV
jgi:hypothetical protein